MKGEAVKAIKITPIPEGTETERQLRECMQDLIDLINEKNDQEFIMQPPTFRAFTQIEDSWSMATAITQGDPAAGITFQAVQPRKRVMEYAIGRQLYNAIMDMIEWLHAENADDTWPLQPATIRSINMIRNKLEAPFTEVSTTWEAIEDE